MSKAKSIQVAVERIRRAITLLEDAKGHLRYARNEQHIPLAVQIAALEETLDILTDAECTPEYYADTAEDDDDSETENTAPRFVGGRWA